jgi:colanic acid/amylovoran biosynthesis glycosyltransferase
MVPDGSAFLAYRDRLVPRSEAQILHRQYLGFRRLRPIWIGRRTDDGLADLGAEPVLLGRRGVSGALDRTLFKQFGRLPAQPDLGRLRPRLIHAHFGRGGALALPIARALGLPLVVTFHGGDATKDTHYRRRLVASVFQRRCLDLQREAALIVCVSDYIREVLLARGFPEAKLKVIRYGTEPEPFGQPPPAARPYLLFVGRLVEKKGVGHLLDAARLLESEGASLDLVVIGDGPLGDGWRRRAAGLRHVEFRGWLPNAEVRRAMQGALAVCVPSVVAKGGDTEGLPHVVLEAMAAAAPVIASAVAGIPEAVKDGETGFLVPPGDPAAIAAAVRRLVGDPALSNRMRLAARAAATERFDAVTQSRILEDALLAVGDTVPA